MREQPLVHKGLLDRLEKLFEQLCDVPLAVLRQSPEHFGARHDGDCRTPDRVGSAVLERLVAAGGVILLQKLMTEPDASFADEEAGAGDQSREVGGLRWLWPNRPAEFVAEGASRRIRELPALGHGEEHRQIHAASVP